MGINNRKLLLSKLRPRQAHLSWLVLLLCPIVSGLFAVLAVALGSTYRGFSIGLPTVIFGLLAVGSALFGLVHIVHYFCDIAYNLYAMHKMMYLFYSGELEQAQSSPDQVDYVD